jgi:hypothetical protein
MNRKLMKALAVVSVFGLSSVALAQEGDAITTALLDLTDFIGRLAAILWFILFAGWGGFRYLY